MLFQPNNIEEIHRKKEILNSYCQNYKKLKKSNQDSSIMYGFIDKKFF